MILKAEWSNGIYLINKLSRTINITPNRNVLIWKKFLFIMVLKVRWKLFNIIINLLPVLFQYQTWFKNLFYVYKIRILIRDADVIFADFGVPFEEQWFGIAEMTTSKSYLNLIFKIFRYNLDFIYDLFHLALTGLNGRFFCQRALYN